MSAATDTSRSSKTRAPALIRALIVGIALLVVALVVWAIASRTTASRRQASASTVVAFTGKYMSVEPIANLQAQIIPLVKEPKLRQRVMETIGLTAQEFGTYTIDCQTKASDYLSPPQFVITTSGPDQTTAARISNAAAAVLIAMRQEAGRASIRRAEQAISSLMSRIAGDSKRSSDYHTLGERLRQLRALEKSVTRNLRIVQPAS